MPWGVVGGGVVGFVGVAGGGATAARHATGRRVTDLPLTLDKLVG
jgi:xanthine dehydrogenase YagR molybdenum-binding subunit